MYTYICLHICIYHRYKEIYKKCLYIDGIYVYLCICVCILPCAHVKYLMYSSLLIIVVLTINDFKFSSIINNRSYYY